MPSDGLLVGAPAALSAQPSGIASALRAIAAHIRLAATAVVDISRSQGPGTAMQIGLVPMRGSRPCHGATSRDALQRTIPTCPCAAMRAPQYAAAPKWLEFRAMTKPT